MSKTKQLLKSDDFRNVRSDELLKKEKGGKYNG